MAKETINVCLVGQKFMGRTHSNGYLKAPKFFDLPLLPVMHTIVGRNRPELEEFKDRWGWQNASTDWKAAISDPEIGLVDIGTPNNMHAEMTIAALEAGKHVACEKPLAGNFAEARMMRDAARKAKKCKTFVWYNYRRVPAIALAYQFVKEGKIGRIYHVRAEYLQDWAGPDVPLIWRFQKKVSGSGAHGDLNAHIIDTARFITGDEISEVSGAVASFEATRFATGNQNRNAIEINGDKGAIKFDFEDMNHLYYYDATAPRKQQGWTQIMVTHGGDHPYAGAWWPDAHVLGYEHGFINQVADMMSVLAGKEPVVPLPDFEDAFKTQQVLEAASVSAAERRPVKISEMK